MRYPAFLKEKGRIGFIAPSFGAVTEPYRTYFDSALNKFHAMGFETVIGPNVRRSDGFGKSSTPENCGAEINSFFTGDLCDVIISAGGGETMCEDLPFVDFEAIGKADPKWFMGYSDNTNLIFTLATIADTAAIYGPCASSFGMKEWHPAISDAFNLLKGSLKLRNYDCWEKYEDENAGPLAGYNCTEPFSMRIFNGSSLTEERTVFSGRLLGGCLDVLSVLCGTGFDKVGEFNDRYRDDGVIWFLESCDLDPRSVRLALWQLKEAGWFDKAKGFIFGRPFRYGAEFMGMGHDDAIMAALGSLKLPILFDADLGHLPPMMPVIAGSLGRVEASGNILTIEQRLV